MEVPQASSSGDWAIGPARGESNHRLRVAGVALAQYRNYDYQAAVQQARAVYEALVVAAAQINVHLSPSAYQAVRRDPADVNQALRQWIAERVGDNVGRMTARSSDGVRGLEAHAFLPLTTPLTDPLAQGNGTRLR